MNYFNKLDNQFNNFQMINKDFNMKYNKIEQ